MERSTRSGSVSPVSSTDSNVRPTLPPLSPATAKAFESRTFEVHSPSLTKTNPEKTAENGYAFKGWSDQPQSLRQTRLTRFFYDIYDIGLCLIPIGLIVKAGLCIHASKIDAPHQGPDFDQVTKLTKGLVRFNMQLTTLFTIIFVLIVASAVRRLALWKAQKGARVSDLEQFQNSVSLTATFKAIWALRAFSLTSLGLIFVWAWYYIGSQASEREYTFQESGPKTDIQLAYVAGQATSPFIDSPASQFPTIRRADMTARYDIYVASIHAGVSKRPYDINGYPLTPLYDQTTASRLDSNHNLRFDADGWLDTTEFSLQHVVSAIGTTLFTNFKDIRSAEFNSSWSDGRVVGTFTYTSTYFMVNCSDTRILNQTTYPGILPVMTMSLNMTPITGTLSKDAPRTFSVWDTFNATHGLQATCQIMQATVDVRTSCTVAGCKAVAVRPAQNVPYPNYRTVFDNDSFAADFFNTLLLASGTPDSVTDLTSLEADNGWDSLKSQLRQNRNSQTNTLAALNNSAYSFSLSIALTTHINTLYDASLHMKYEYDIDHQLISTSAFSIDPSNTNFTSVQIRGAEVSERYEINMGWIVVDMISNFVLLVAAIFAFWLRRQTLAPDVFGYVSSLTRDNPHLNLPNGGSALSGMDRARRMKNVKVRFGDIVHEDGLGRIVMTHAGDGVNNIRRLDRKKTYR